MPHRLGLIVFPLPFVLIYNIVEHSTLYILDGIQTDIMYYIQSSSLVRVPFEVTKQRAQANRSLSPLQIVQTTWKTEVCQKSNYSPSFTYIVSV